MFSGCILEELKSSCPFLHLLLKFVAYAIQLDLKWSEFVLVTNKDLFTAVSGMSSQLELSLVGLYPF